MPAGTWEQKRHALLQRLAREAPHGNNQITVVFDSREGSGDRSQLGSIEVVFTSGETADDWISHEVRRASNPLILVVVSDDQGVRLLVRGTGAKWLSNEDFWRQVKVPKAQHTTPEPGMNSESITDEFKKKWL